MNRDTALTQEHQSFADAFCRNDPALLMRYIDENTVLFCEDGVVYSGASAVLSYLVGDTMSKVSNHIDRIDDVVDLGHDITKVTYITSKYSNYCSFAERIIWKDYQIKLILRLKIVEMQDQRGPMEVMMGGILTLVTPFTLKGRLLFRKMEKAASPIDKPEPFFGHKISISDIHVSSLENYRRSHSSLNPYVKIIDAHGKELWRSTVIRNCCNPSWEDKFDIYLPDDVEAFHVVLKDKQLISRDIILMTEVCMKDIDLYEEKSYHFSFSNDDEESSEISMRMKRYRMQGYTKQNDSSHLSTNRSLCKAISSVGLDARVGMDLMFRFAGLLMNTKKYTDVN